MTLIQQYQDVRAVHYCKIFHISELTFPNLNTPTILPSSDVWSVTFFLADDSWVYVATETQTNHFYRKWRNSRKSFIKLTTMKYFYPLIPQTVNYKQRKKHDYATVQYITMKNLWISPQKALKQVFCMPQKSQCNTIYYYYISVTYSRKVYNKHAMQCHCHAARKMYKENLKCLIEKLFETL